MTDDRGTDKYQLTQRERHLIEALTAIAERKTRELENDPLYRFYRFLFGVRARVRSITKRRNSGDK